MSTEGKPVKPAKPVSASQAEMLQLVLPSDANTLGNALGGVVMHHMDICAAIAAQRHAGRACVTASVDRIDFERPVRVGELLVLLASVNYAGTTSMEVGVRCLAENPSTGERRHTASAYFTFVSLGDELRPAPVPRLRPESPDEVRRHEEARQRRESRLGRRRVRAPDRASDAPPPSRTLAAGRNE